MLTNLRLGNFKAFGATQSIPLRPITLVFGANSSGKSSIIHAILLSHHIVSTGNVDAKQTELGGEVVDLGGFRRYVHLHNSREDVTLQHTFVNQRLELGFGHSNAERGQAFLCKEVEFELQIGEPEGNSQFHYPRVSSYEFNVEGEPLLSLKEASSHFSPYVSDVFAELSPTDNQQPFVVETLNAQHPLWVRIVASFLSEDDGLDERPYTFSDEIKRRAVERALRGIEIVVTSAFNFNVSIRPSQFLNNTEDMFEEDLEYLDSTSYDSGDADEVYTFTSLNFYDGDKETDLAESFAIIIKNLILASIKLLKDNLIRAKLDYLGPLRSYPERIVVNSRTDHRAGGNFVWQALREDANLLDRVNKWLGQNFLRTRYRLEVEALYSMSDLARLIDGATEKKESILRAIQSSAPALTNINLVDLGTGTRVSHRDVGVGISQVLPVLAHAFGSSERLIMIEQPEIHLHPALQAELADVLIESALSEAQNQFLLETHSEHLILRLMRRIRETAKGVPHQGITLKPEDVSILYVEPGSKGAVVRVLEINRRGELVSPWPGGFFEEGYRERFS